MRNDFERAMEFRYSCKLFDKSRKIPKEDLEFILNQGRMSPSSMGMEPTRYLVIENIELRERIQEVCWNQPQITTCSHLIAFLSMRNLRSSNSYVESQIRRKDIPEEIVGKILNVYKNFIDPRSDEEILEWAKRQSYLASANMMTAAASIEIDSCPIEGFDIEKLREILPYDKSEFDIAYMVAFGYRADEPKRRARLDLEDLVFYR